MEGMKITCGGRPPVIEAPKEENREIIKLDIERWLVGSLHWLCFLFACFFTFYLIVLSIVYAN